MSSDETSEGKTEKKTDEEALAEGVQLLLPIETLLSAGVHIGTRIKTADLEPFIFRVRPDGLFVLDIRKTDERIRKAAKLLTHFDPSRILVVSARLYGRTPVKKFAEATKSVAMTGRFMPGLLSNPSYPNHLEPHVIIVTDPKADEQAVDEAATIGVPVVSLCDTDNTFTNVDFVIPSNNKGRRALATIYWLLARQYLREKGEIPPDGELSSSIDDFETKLAEIEEITEAE